MASVGVHGLEHVDALARFDGSSLVLVLDDVETHSLESLERDVLATQCYPSPLGGFSELDDLPLPPTAFGVSPSFSFHCPFDLTRSCDVNQLHGLRGSSEGCQRGWSKLPVESGQLKSYVLPFPLGTPAGVSGLWPSPPAISRAYQVTYHMTSL